MPKSWNKAFAEVLRLYDYLLVAACAKVVAEHY